MHIDVNIQLVYGLKCHIICVVYSTNCVNDIIPEEADILNC